MDWTIVATEEIDGSLETGDWFHDDAGDKVDDSEDKTEYE